MSISSPLRRTLFPAVSISSSLLLLAGCSAGDADTLAGQAGAEPGQEQASGERAVDLASKGTVIVRLPDKSFTFIATTCMQSAEDLLVSGPGVDNETREIAYFDLDFVNMDSSTSGGARINLGTDQPMTSSDEFYVVHVGDGEEYSIMNEEKMTIEGIFRAGNGEPVGSGTVVITCD